MKNIMREWLRKYVSCLYNQTVISSTSQFIIQRQIDFKNASYLRIVVFLYLPYFIQYWLPLRNIDIDF